MRFGKSIWGYFPEVMAKRMMKLLAMYLTSIFFPGIDIAMTAQTKENAAELIKDKT